MVCWLTTLGCGTLSSVGSNKHGNTAAIATHDEFDGRLVIVQRQSKLDVLLLQLTNFATLLDHSRHTQNSYHRHKTHQIGNYFRKTFIR